MSINTLLQRTEPYRLQLDVLPMNLKKNETYTIGGGKKSQQGSENTFSNSLIVHEYIVQSDSVNGTT